MSLLARYLSAAVNAHTGELVAFDRDSVLTSWTQ
jgi:hypothetical protein